MEILIGARKIGAKYPTYFIADIAANHDGDLERAKKLIHSAKEAGADGAKFQNFRAPKIVSDYGYKNMGAQVSHQASWQKSVFEVYQDASVPFEWTPILKDTCDEVGIDYFSSPYDYDAIDMLDPYVPAFKAGSGLMSWPDATIRMAQKGKPIMIATGASDIADVSRVIRAVMEVNHQIVLMQCNTNYTASTGNYDHLHLNVIKTYGQIFPDVVLGLSDHTHSPAPVVGAVTLGARVIERHFTDNNEREGPDHKFALNPGDWSEMVQQVRILERALGSSDKYVAANERDTVIVQRRCLRAGRDILAGEILDQDMIDVLRPATPGGIAPHLLDQVIGTRTLVDIPFGKELRWTDLGA